VRLSDDGYRLTVRDRGRGMTGREVMQDLLVPFCSSKDHDEVAIGEHGIGFFASLEIAPRVEVLTSTGGEARRLVIDPVGDGPHHGDFSFRLETVDPASVTRGTTVTLWLLRPMTRTALATEITAAARLVDPYVARIFVNDILVNTARAHMRRVARVPVQLRGASTGELALYFGRGDGVEPTWAVTQGGLLVTLRQDAFAGSDFALHRDLVRAVVAAGYALLVELPAAVPLNKGRSAVAAYAAAEVDRAIVRAFERFILEDALYDRELLRAVDHRLSTVLDRLVMGALMGEPMPEPPPALEPVPVASKPANDEAPRAPTVAAPEEVVRFAAALVDAPAFALVSYDMQGGELRHVATLRGILAAFRGGALRAYGESQHPGLLYLPTNDPLADALWRRLMPPPHTAEAAFAPAGEPTAPPTPALERVSRTAVVTAAAHLPGAGTLAAAMTILEHIDAAISAAADLPPSPVTVHQALYGRDEMAHTDGTGISVNLASLRVRALLAAVVTEDDAMAFSALVDLLLHEKTHVSLASVVPRASAEHGTTFYRRKDLLRRRLLEALASNKVVDPMLWLPTARAGIGRARLPSMEALAAAFALPQRRAA
jgi:hypothetical protein